MIELLAPCGGMEQLRAAIKYGADAVYVGTKQFSLRAHADNFQSLKEPCDYAHDHGKKIYVAMNSVISPSMIVEAKEAILEIYNAGADAIIVSDPGLIELTKQIAPQLEIHLSTQVSTSNQYAASFWHKAGVKRIVLARECTLEDVKTINENTPEGLELEAFCHGAMCIAYSGRCLLSSYFTGRSANCGDCTQPCRWEYEITEVKRPEDGMIIEQDNHGTYILSSKDLNMIEYIPQMIDAGIISFKIEGRMKTAFYVGSVVRAYRMAIDAVLAGKPVPKAAFEETCKASHRRYTTGFFFGNPLEEGQQYDRQAYIRESEFTGIVLDYDHQKKQAIIEQRYKFLKGDRLEVMMADGTNKELIVHHMYDEFGNEIESAPHPQQRIYIDCDFEVCYGDLIRKDKE